MTTKGYKVTDAERKSRFGIAVKNFDELKKKSIDKFKLKFSPGQIDIQTPDGFLIENDEYFQTLPAQTLLIWVKKGERAETDAELLYKTIREVNEEYLSAGEKVQEFFSEKMKVKVLKLAEVLKGIDTEKTKLSSKGDHPEWFEGLDTSAKTKEDYMFRRAQDRIRTYYYKTKQDLLKAANNPSTQEHKIALRHDQLHTLLTELQCKLKLNKYHGHYFDRKSHVGDAHLNPLCNSEGVFVCEGRWDRDMCLYHPMHSINPYSSREERIVFQTWNLDHNVERSRSIVPAVLNALKRCKSEVEATSEECCLDVKRIYNDLFTRHNLKFVHIVCHDKGAHVAKKSDNYLL